MNLPSINLIKPQLFIIIKFISIPLITGGIALEIWNIQTSIINQQIPVFLHPILLLIHIAISAHLIEAMIAAIYAPRKNKHPIKYAIYTFFVGTVALLELWEQ